MNLPESDDPDNAVSNDAINFLLLIQNFSICKSKERFVEALNRSRREALNISTQRKSSEFEFVDRSLQSTTRRRKRFQNLINDEVIELQTGLRNKKVREIQMKEDYVNVFQNTFNG